MVAGTLPPGTVQAVAAVSDPLVQMSTTTLNSFTHWFFIYQMTTLIEVLVIGFLVFVLKPFIPFVLSRIWNHLPVVGIMTRVRNIIPLGGFTLRNGLYRKEYSDNVMYYDKKYLGSYFFMGVPFDFVHIDRGFVNEPIYNKYLITLAKMGYKNVIAIDNALTFNGVDPNGEDTPALVQNMGYESYDSAKLMINPANLTNTTEIYAPIASSAPLDALLNYGADIPPGSIAAQVSDTIMWRKPPVEPNLLLDILPYAVIVLAMGISGAMLLTQIK